MKTTLTVAAASFAVGLILGVACAGRYEMHWDHDAESDARVAVRLDRLTGKVRMMSTFGGLDMPDHPYDRNAKESIR